MLKAAELNLDKREDLHCLPWGKEFRKKAVITRRVAVTGTRRHCSPCDKPCKLQDQEKDMRVLRQSGERGGFLVTGKAEAGS